MSRQRQEWFCPTCGAHIETAVPLVAAPTHSCPRKAGRSSELLAVEPVG